MTQGSRRNGAGASGRDERSAEAQAALDQMRVQAGGALSGRELGDRLGRRDHTDDHAPPLDWRLTPRNVALQVLAVALFLAAGWLMLSLMTDGVVSMLDFVTGG